MIWEKQEDIEYKYRVLKIDIHRKPDFFLYIGTLGCSKRSSQIIGFIHSNNIETVIYTEVKNYKNTNNGSMDCKDGRISGDG